MSFLKFSTVGKLSRDPEEYFNQSNGSRFLKLTVPVNKSTKLPSGEFSTSTTWMTYFLFNELHIKSAEQCQKGTVVYIDGNFSTKENSTPTNPIYSFSVLTFTVLANRKMKEMVELDNPYQNNTEQDNFEINQARQRLEIQQFEKEFNCEPTGIIQSKDKIVEKYDEEAPF